MDATTRKLIRDYASTVIGAVIAAVLIRVYVIEAYRIPTQAMRPTLEPGDTVFVAKSPWGASLFSSAETKRGDVILFRSEDPASRDYIKRVVGLPGETIELHKGRLSINGKAVAEKFENHQSCGEQTLPDHEASGVCYEAPLPEDIAATKIPEDSYFVLGDYRSLTQVDPTLNAKSWGVIPKSWVKGKVVWLWLSIEPTAPSEMGVPSRSFPKFRFDRMFRRIR